MLLLPETWLTNVVAYDIHTATHTVLSRNRQVMRRRIRRNSGRVMCLVKSTIANCIPKLDTEIKVTLWVGQ